ncbi:MAG: bifunctional nuclease family protein [Planctomycetaceae bacterium]|nr:bifunctional nuclease family protein [Planctomycetaceae bacterium]
MAELVEMQLSRIIISEINDQQVLYLSEVDGERMFPILVGLFEATRIDQRIKGDVPPRPLTHDLVKNIINQLGGEPIDVIINSLHEHTYYAVIRIQKGGEIIEIDARPSDAIALAMHYDPPLPIFVEDDVLQEAA